MCIHCNLCRCHTISVHFLREVSSQPDTVFLAIPHKTTLSVHNLAYPAYMFGPSRSGCRVPRRDAVRRQSRRRARSTRSTRAGGQAGRRAGRQVADGPATLQQAGSSYVGADGSTQAAMRMSRGRRHAGRRGGDRRGTGRRGCAFSVLFFVTNSSDVHSDCVCSFSLLRCPPSSSCPTLTAFQAVRVPTHRHLQWRTAVCYDHEHSRCAASMGVVLLSLSFCSVCLSSFYSATQNCSATAACAATAPRAATAARTAMDAPPLWPRSSRQVDAGHVHEAVGCDGERKDSLMLERRLWEVATDRRSRSW